MKNFTKVNIKLLIMTIVIVVCLAAVYQFYWDETKIIIRRVLEAKLTTFILWVIIVLIFLVHYFKNKSKEVESETIITRKFGIFIDNCLGGVTYATTITTSLTLLKGIYIQTFFCDKMYFAEFQALDLMTIFGVTVFLLYFSIMKVVDIAKETYKVERTEQVLNEEKIVVVPDRNFDNN